MTTVLERYFLYFPTKALSSTPADAGLHYEERELIAEDGVALHGWFVPGDTERIFLWCHGNSGNVADRVPILAACFKRLGGSHLLFDYRGYGRSRGAPGERGLYRDARAALRSLCADTGTVPAKVCYLGHSLGAAVALQLALENPPRGLVLESPFTSLADMARLHYPRLPARPFVRSSFHSLNKIRDVKAPVLVLHGEADDIIPVEYGRRLYEAAPEPKQFVSIPGAGHDDLWLKAEPYFSALERFLPIS